MDFDFDNSSVLYVLGAILGIVAVLYFGGEVILRFSPVVKSALMFLGFVTFLIAANAVRTAILDTAFYLLSVTSYVAFLGYTIGKFDLGTDGTFFALAVSSALFLSLGYVVRETEFGLQPAHAKITLGVILLVVAGLVAFDVVGAQPQYTLQLKDEVNVTAPGKVELGTATVANRFVLSRNLDPPEYEACLYTPRKHVVQIYMDPTYGGQPDVLDSGDVRETEIGIHVPKLGEREDEGESEPANLGTIPVKQRDDCPETSETSRIVVATRDS
jgi:hypothetical protein